ncbi:AfsR/SARP family transcriptional regulator [Pseudonocardia sp. TRM90224]|uniref:AfsR/SARP family transcriptional regulator n=1 Tax=Pseudonocardia sp. TRM90224 TaxID=2812678 RepID=UPI001E4C420C|nr:BTAD domain-containing putative transcriptional regulator [Pseudonocardia sp. TRM90224]
MGGVVRGCDTVEMDVLGQTQVSLNGAVLTLARPFERALFVRLALAEGAPVGIERLIVDLWPGCAEAKAVARLRVLISRLRAALGSAPLVQLEPAGYQLAATADLDLHRARAAIATIQTADRGKVIETAAAALALWRGPSFADLCQFPFGAAHAQVCDELRLDLAIHLHTAQLQIGAAAAAVGELTELAAAHPFNETVQCLLAHALYGTGRQVEALQLLGNVRRTLVGELGVDVAARTADLELRILRHDPTLLQNRSGRPTHRAPTRSTRQTVPARTGPLVGRAAETGEGLRRLERPGLTTLVGPMGSGKSRLAVELAHRAIAAGRSVGYLDLADSGGGHDVQAAAIEAAIVDAVPSADAVLVLDNAEHVVEDVGRAALQLRRTAPALHVLVTSQRPLLLEHETQQHVGPLPPDAAAELFRQHAGPHVRPADGDQVRRIVEAVDRLPLVIVLAAAATRTFSVEQLAARIEHNPLRLLNIGTRDAGRRHSSLLGAFDRACAHLTAPERTVLGQIAMFDRPFHLEAAEALAAGFGTPPGCVAPALATLVEQNLVVVHPGERRRFALLTTTRHFLRGQRAAIPVNSAG